MSKSTLNQQIVTLAKEMKEAEDKIILLAVYPGYVITRLSHFRSKNNMKECMNEIIEVIERSKLSDFETFLD